MTKQQIITIANGHSPYLIIESFIVLKDVLYVPQLTNSFIFIQKFTQDLNCSITFFHLLNVYFMTLPCGRWS